MMAETQGNAVYGTETLEVISEAVQFNRWMYQTIRPHCQGNILEAGSGIGNISRFFLEHGSFITLSDFDTEYLPRLQQRFGQYPNLQGVYRIDLSDRDMEKQHAALLGSFDTVFALNVLEHVGDQAQALQNMYKLLRKGGKVLILVPAFQCLFNGFDEQLEHHRRYTAKSLKKELERAGFSVTSSSYFNFMAIFGWFVSGTLLRKRMIPAGQMRFFDALVPLWKLLDRVFSRFAGISVIQVGQKPA